MDISQTILSEITIFNKYARYIPEISRRESWQELCERNMAMHIRKYPALKGEIQAVYHDFVIPKKVLPSMRSLQFGGASIEISNSRIYNCFSRDTTFITSSGNKSFLDFNNGDTTIVLSHLGNWKNAVVKSYGNQELTKITLTKGKSTKIVKATKNHRWILRDGKESTELKVGDCLFPIKGSSNFDYDSATPFEKLYWCYGYTFGDGTKVKDKNGEYKWSMVRLCGQDKNLYSSRFEEMGFESSSSLSCGGDPIFYMGTYLKTAPTLETTELGLIKAFMDGYLCADAEKNSNWHKDNSKSKYTSILSAGTDHTNFLDKALDLCGYFITRRSDVSDEITNFGQRKSGSTSFGITNNIGLLPNTGWSVSNIENLQGMEEVWCLEVEEDHSFILSGGVTTGNCAYLPIDHPDAFSETMFLLLGGTGVGFGVQTHQVAKLPVVLGPKDKLRRFLIGDSIEGWADAIKILVESYFHGKSDPVFDYRDIRPKGARLITSGGKAPGPAPLRICIEQIRAIFANAVGRQLTSLEAHDIQCHIADAVLSGGIRRAAMISLFSKDDMDMLSSKSGPWWELNPQRGRANNSVVLDRKNISDEEFFDIWERVQESGAGEPGIFWTNDIDLGTNPCAEIALNPCQFCVSGDTNLITKEGISTISEVVGKEIEIWNGEEWSKVSPYQTGESDTLYRVWFSDGSYLDATENHKFLVKNRFQKEYYEAETHELLSLVEDSKYGLMVPPKNINYEVGGVTNEYAYEYGFILGDGHIHNEAIYLCLYSDEKKLISFKNSSEVGNYHNVYGTPYTTLRFDGLDINLCKNLKYEAGLPKEIFSWNKETILSFISGWADADGSDDDKGVRIYGREDKIRLLQLLLSKCGVYSSVNLMQEAGIMTNLGIRKNAVWYVQITKTDEFMFKRLSSNNNLGPKYKGKNQKIRKIEILPGKHKSYCVTEEKLHQCVFNNVLTKQCNVTEINASDITSQEDFNARAKAAAFLGTVQAGYTDFHYLRPEWKEITEKEALIGVGMTGIGSGAVLPLNLKEAAAVVVVENERVANILGINKAARTTTIKPSGTTSCVVGSSSGIHAWHNDFYVRRMRVGKNEALYHYMKDAFPTLVEDCFHKPHLEAVMSFPQKAPRGAIVRTESFMDLLERVKRFNIEWVHQGHREGTNFHNVSCTISLKNSEWGKCGRWMWKNRDFYTGISVLPYDGGTYIQAPFTDCTEQEYNDMMSVLQGSIDLTRVKEEGDNTSLKEQVACAGGACEIQ
jgi:hypothetical protein